MLIPTLTLTRERADKALSKLTVQAAEAHSSAGFLIAGKCPGVVESSGMKRIGLLVFFGAVMACFPQGTVNFANLAPGVNAPFCDANNVPLGNGYLAQLYAGPAGTVNPSLLTPDGISGGPATFGSPTPGYFQGGNRVIASVPAGNTVTLQVRVWAAATGSSWETATERGESNLIQVTLGTVGFPTPNLVGLQGTCLVPEPSSAVLGFTAAFAAAVVGMRGRVR